MIFASNRTPLCNLCTPWCNVCTLCNLRRQGIVREYGEEAEEGNLMEHLGWRVIRVMVMNLSSRAAGSLGKAAGALPADLPAQAHVAAHRCAEEI